MNYLIDTAFWCKLINVCNTVKAPEKSGRPFRLVNKKLGVRTKFTIQPFDNIFAIEFSKSRRFKVNVSIESLPDHNDCRFMYYPMSSLTEVRLANPDLVAIHLDSHFLMVSPKIAEINFTLMGIDQDQFEDELSYLMLHA